MSRALKEKEKERGAVVPWRPFSEMARWEQQMERLFDDLFTRRLRPMWDERWWPGKSATVSIPAVDLYEDQDAIVVKVELPGMEKNDIEVNVSDSFLTIKGEKKREKEIKEENYYRAERSYGSFSRTLELPKGVQAEKAQASFKEGVLEVRLPKTEEAKKKQIKLKVE